MPKKDTVQNFASPADEVEYQARLFVRVWCGLRTQEYPWDDLDYLLELVIRNDEARAKRLVDALMEHGPNVDVPRALMRLGTDNWDAAEAVAVRIIGNLDLRYLDSFDSSHKHHLILTSVGPDKDKVLEILREEVVFGKNEAKDAKAIVGSTLPLDIMQSPQLSTVEDTKRLLEAAGATVEITGGKDND